ncbi:MAG: sugar ABC transporter permease [Clostridia bacterium]|nr:sugar ABC transporter permease [Clostridia bacterium]
MFGAVLAFKDYNYAKGIFGSDWVGFDNFKFFFLSQDAWRITRNTLGYAVVFLVTNTVASMAVALLMFEVSSRKAIKTYQTILILPHFMSWVIVGYITYILFNSEQGVLNQLLTVFGQEKIDWYSSPQYWPFILPIVNIWKSVGMSSLMYYATLVGMDDSIYEAAVIDGAGRWRQTISISVPSLIPMMTILTIMNVGGIFRSDFGLFYQITRDVGSLYPTTDVVDTYIYRGLRTGDVGITAAVGLFQSFVGLVLVVFTNWVVKKIEPDNAMF